MKTTKIVRYSILPISDNQRFREFPIKVDFERQYFMRSEMYFKILSDRARDDRKHDETECKNRNRTSIEAHMSEKKIYDRHQNGYLRKPSGNQGSAQLIHSPENLQRKLLDTSKHKTC